MGFLDNDKRPTNVHFCGKTIVYITHWMTVPLTHNYIYIIISRLRCVSANLYRVFGSQCKTMQIDSHKLHVFNVTPSRIQNDGTLLWYYLESLIMYFHCPTMVIKSPLRRHLLEFLGSFNYYGRQGSIVDRINGLEKHVQPVITERRNANLIFIRWITLVLISKVCSWLLDPPQKIRYHR